MMDFKSMLALDVDEVFLCGDEFAEMHRINDEWVECVIDELLTKESADTLTNPMEGVFINGITIYVKTGDIRKPVEGEVLMIDGRMHLVKRVSDEMGLLTIVAESNEQ